MIACIDCGALFVRRNAACEPPCPFDDLAEADEDGIPLGVWAPDMARRDDSRCNSCGYDAALEACGADAAQTGRHPRDAPLRATRWQIEHDRCVR